MPAHTYFRLRAPSRGSSRAQAPTVATAGDLATAVRAVCVLGIGARSRGACLGGGLATQVSCAYSSGELGVDGECGKARPGELREPTSIIAVCRPPGSLQHRSRWAARAVRHRRKGHDLGCFALGVPLCELGALIERWGGSDAAGYLLDAAEEASNIIAGEKPWSAGSAQEILELCLVRRISLTVPGDRTMQILR